MQWWDNGAHVRDELPTADHRYRDGLIEIHRRDEAENGLVSLGATRDRREAVRRDDRQRATIPEVERPQ